MGEKRAVVTSLNGALLWACARCQRPYGDRSRPEPEDLWGGVVGYFMGGGFGYLSGKLGLGADSVLRLGVVTASGEHRTTHLVGYELIRNACVECT